MKAKEIDSKKHDNAVPKNKSQALADKVMAILTSSDDYNQAVKQFKEQDENNKRIYGELKKFRKDQIRLESSIANLKESFGEENSIDDLKQLKEWKRDLEATIEAIALLEQRTGGRGIGRDLEDCKIKVGSCFERTLVEVKKEWQEEVNKLVDDFIAAIEDYSMASSIIQKEHLKLYPSKIASLSWFLNLRPKIENFIRLERLTDEVNTFIAVTKSADSLLQPGRENNIENIFN